MGPNNQPKVCCVRTLRMQADSEAIIQNTGQIALRRAAGMGCRPGTSGACQGKGQRWIQAPLGRVACKGRARKGGGALLLTSTMLMQLMMSDCRGMSAGGGQACRWCGASGQCHVIKEGNKNKKRMPKCRRGGRVAGKPTKQQGAQGAHGARQRLLTRAVTGCRPTMWLAGPAALGAHKLLPGRAGQASKRSSDVGVGRGWNREVQLRGGRSLAKRRQVKMLPPAFCQAGASRDER